ncbi:hypothetical protein FXO38_01648 [Capsicum annuum]|nr:hypothetical protein FXO38_01648 [Capsicum annuum]
MSEKIKFDSIPSRKSPRIIQEHSPINLSRPSFDLGCFTPSSKSNIKQKVVEVDSIPHNKIKILSKSDCSKISPSLKQQQLNMQSTRVSKKVVVPDFEKVDKRKKNVGQHDFDSDFEDEVFVSKMKKSKKEIPENARVTRSKVSVSIGKVDDNKSDKKKSRNVCKYVFRDIVFTNEDEVKFNLGAIHQDSLGHEHRNDSDHSVPSISEDKFTVLKNEIANVRRDMPLFQEKVFKEMIEYQKKVDSEFNGMREFVQESMKLILNELRLVKQQLSEFIEKKSPLDDIPFFTESQLVALEPTFRVLETPKAHIAMPIVFGKSSEDVYNQSDTSFRRCLLYFKSKHPFQECIDFETPNLLIEQFTDWCYPNSKCLYVYDSMMGGVIHSKNVLDHVRSLSTMIPMFLVVTNFYGKRSDIDWHREAVYIDKSLSEPLEYVILKDTPQQEPQSNDYGMFVCAFAEYVSHGMFDISSILFDAVNHPIRYGALLWNYARRKQNDGAISESEITGNITSKYGGFKRSRE